MTIRTMSRRLLLLAAGTAILAAGHGVALGGDAAFAADETGWTWNSATHPAGSGDMNAGSLGGVFLANGMYYVPTVGHMVSLGGWKQEMSTGSGGYGYGAYRVQNLALDAGLIATGTRPLRGVIRVSDGWQDADIMSVAHPGEIVAGAFTCHSGVSATTRAAGGYRCGTVTTTCTAAQNLCFMSNSAGLVQGGDSGGPVWQYATGGVKLLGWIVGGNSPLDSSSYPNYATATFTPAWAMQNHTWTAAESWTGSAGIAPFPPGAMSTGCFVTYSGCVRS